MKKKLIIPLLFGIILAVLAIPVHAQTPATSATPQPKASGEVTGVLVNRSPGGNIPGSLSVMLHILDQNYNQLGMLHTQSLPDGSFRFEDVPLNQNELYAGIVAYQGATYYSQPVPYDGENNPNLELPIYESTSDLSKVQVDEMHVLFNFAQDGLEVNEIYLLSNLGEFTVTGTLTLTDGQPATIEFPLPAGADYVFFKPETSDRFVKLADGFADKAPIVPGERSNSIMVSYLLPYTDVMSYSYTAPLAIGNIDFLLPAEEGVILDGPNLAGPEVTTLQDNSIYQVYTYKGLPDGQTVSFNFLGKPNIETSGATDKSLTRPVVLTSKLAIEIGSAVFGVAMIAVGVWQWRRNKGDMSEEDAGDDNYDADPDEVIAKIARLDEDRERGEIDEVEYTQQRAALRKQAKALLEQKDE
jgi:hypothetical protein